MLSPGWRLLCFMTAQQKNSRVKKSDTSATQARASQAPRKRLKRAVAERASARVEERLAAQQAKIRQKVLDDKAKAQEKIQAKKRRERAAIAQKKAQHKAALAAQQAEQRAAVAATRAQARADKQAAIDEQRAAVAAIRAQARADQQAAIDEQRARRDREQQLREQERRRLAEQRVEAKRLNAEAKVARAMHQLAERAQSKAERAAERQRQLAETSMAKGARQEALKLARAQALADKEAARQEAARKREALKHLQVTEKGQGRRWGAPLPALFNAWRQIFRERDDVVVQRDEAAPLGDLESACVEGANPDQAIWMRTAGTVHFNWHAALRPEVRGSFSFDPGVITIDDAWFEQLRHAAQNAFLVGGPEAVERGRALLAHTSIPPFTSSTLLLSLLEQRGLDKQLAKALIDWLGQGAHFLFSIAATDEGRRRRRLLEQAARAPTAADTVDAQLVAALNQGPALDKAVLLALLKDHGGFVSAGGSYGTFMVTARNKLPHVLYEHDTPRPGQLNLMVENLTGHKFTGMQLDYSNLCGCRCDDGHFSRATLHGACLRYTHLTGAQFHGADLSHADLGHAELSGADFRKANLTGTNFERANLSGANFAGATVAGTKFAGAEVRGIKY